MTPTRSPRGVRSTLGTLAIACAAFGITTAQASEDVPCGNSTGDRDITPVREEIKVVRPAERGLINQSVILSDGLNWTLVPKGAVIHLPVDHSARVGTRPIGNLLP